MIKGDLEKLLRGALSSLGISGEEATLEHPEELSHGDYSTNVALVYAKELGMNPRELAEKIASSCQGLALTGKGVVERVTVAGAGFINFFLSKEFFADSISEIVKSGEKFGRNQSLKGQRVLVEYTDPNPFKVFHIGHLMSNAIGESIARLFEFSGAEVKRLCYQGDVGLHVAKAIWGMMQKKIRNLPTGKAGSQFTIHNLGMAYAFGAENYETDDKVQREIKDINKKIFDKSDSKINALYDWGRKVSLEHFEEIYKRLGTKFDNYFFESEVAADGLKIVKEFLKRGVFAESEGAVVFRGEEHGLHTRVFVTSQGLPTYETKELGLNKQKFDLLKPDLSVIVTANEQNDYFKVVLRVLSIIYPEIGNKTRHIGHGMLRFASGKMASRKGNVITGESLLDGVEEMVREKIKDRDFDVKTAEHVAGKVAVGAIKYSIMRQHIGGDIVYDPETSISFEGDSGPYLQYSHARACSVLRKAGNDKVRPFSRLPPSPGYGRAGKVEPLEIPEEIGSLERLLVRFPEVVALSQQEYAPHRVTTYLTELAAAFNSFYAHSPILTAGKEMSYRLALTRAFTMTMKNGLYLLGIEAPEIM